MRTRNKIYPDLPFPKIELDLAPPFPKVDVDFDEASAAWRENKKSVGNGCYKYICCVVDKNGKKCGVKRLE